MFKRNDPDITNFGLLNLRLKEIILEIIEKVCDIVIALRGSELSDMSEFSVNSIGIISAVIGLYNSWLKVT